MPPRNRVAAAAIARKNLYLPDPPAADPGVHTLLKPVRFTANKQRRHLDDGRAHAGDGADCLAGQERGDPSRN